MKGVVKDRELNEDMVNEGTVEQGVKMRCSIQPLAVSILIHGRVK